MRSRIGLITFFSAALLLAAVIACSKKSASPTQPSVCSVSPTSLNFGTVDPGFVSAEKTFTISNTGGGTLEGSVSGGCGNFSVEAEPNTYHLGAGQSTTIRVRFTPFSAGAKSCTVTTGCSQSVTLSGIGGEGACEVVPDTLDFGDITVGQSRDLTFAIHNTGISASLSGTASESCPDFVFVGPASYGPILPGQSASLTLRFLSRQVGPQSCIVNTGSSRCPTITCVGTGIAVSADCDLIPDGLLFGDMAIGSRSDATFAIRNNGTGRLVGTVSENCEEFSIAGLTAYDLSPGASQSFVVRFEPLYEGEKICRVNTGTGCAAMPVSGNGIVGCEFSTPSLAFGRVAHGGGGYREFSVTNNTNVQLAGSFYPPYPFTVRTMGGVVNRFSVDPHQTQVFGVSFTPPTERTTCDTILYQGSISTDSPLCGEVAVSGVGVWGCDCSVTPTSWDFASVVVGEGSPTKNVTVRNTHPQLDSRGAIRVISGDFVAPASYGSCGHCGICTSLVPIYFRPQRLGFQTGKIVFDPPSGCLIGGTPCDTLTVTGTGITAAGAR